MENIIKFTIGHNDDNEMLSNLTNIIEATVCKNAELVSFTIEKEVSGDVDFILNSYIDHLLSLMLRDFDKDKLLSLVSSGALFSLRELLEDKLMSNTLIQEVIENKKEVAV